VAELKITVVTSGDPSGTQSVTKALQETSAEAERLQQGLAKAATANTGLAQASQSTASAAKQAAGANNDLATSQEKVRRTAGNQEELDAQNEVFKQMTAEAKQAAAAIEKGPQSSLRKLGEGFSRLSQAVPAVGEAAKLLVNPWAAVAGAVIGVVNHVKKLIEEQDKVTEEAIKTSRAYDDLRVDIQNIRGDWEKTIDTLQDYQDALAETKAESESPEAVKRREERKAEREARKQDRIDAAETAKQEAMIDAQVATRQLTKEQGETQKRTLRRQLEDRTAEREVGLTERKAQIAQEAELAFRNQQWWVRGNLQEELNRAEQMEKTARVARAGLSVTQEQRKKDIADLDTEIANLEKESASGSGRFPTSYYQDRIQRRIASRDTLRTAMITAEEDVASKEKDAAAQRAYVARIVEHGKSAERGIYAQREDYNVQTAEAQAERQAMKAERNAALIRDTVADLVQTQEQVQTLVKEHSSANTQTIIALSREVELLKQRLARLQGQQ
jgi:hypothetical protein